MNVIKDLIDGSTISDSLSGGPKITRAFLVTDVGGDAVGRLANAMGASGVPTIGEGHPTATGMVCTDKSASAINGDNSQFKVICNYSWPQFPPTDKGVIQIGSTVQSAQTTLDKDGKEVILGPFQFVDKLGTNHEAPEQAGLINKQYPNPVISFERTENDGQTLLDAVIKYVGCVNSSSFLGCSAEKILCTRIQGSSSDGGKTYKASYEFQVNLNTWKAGVVYVDQSTGLPHKKATVANNGKKQVSIYPQADFNALRLQ